MTTNKNGCYNREAFKESLMVPDGYTGKEYVVTWDGKIPIRVQRMKEIPFVMSTTCQHDRRSTDPRCEGCKWL